MKSNITVYGRRQYECVASCRGPSQRRRASVTLLRQRDQTWVGHAPKVNRLKLLLIIWCMIRPKHLLMPICWKASTPHVWPNASSTWRTVQIPRRSGCPWRVSQMRATPMWCPQGSQRQTQGSGVKCIGPDYARSPCSSCGHDQHQKG
jgi:hypothetical protein